MEEKIFGIKVFDSKDREDVAIVAILFILFGLPFIGGIFNVDAYTSTETNIETCYSGPITEYNYMYRSGMIDDCPGIAIEREAMRSRIENPVQISVDYNARINYALSVVDQRIKGITSVLVVDNKDLDCPTSEYGCVNFLLKNGIPVSATIKLVKDYSGSCYTFEYVLYHEFGHIDQLFKDGNRGTESEADNFADQYAKKKC